MATEHIVETPVVKGDVHRLPRAVKAFIERKVVQCQPDKIHICDGSDSEMQELLMLMKDLGMIQPLPKYKNCWLACTDPRDVARVEEKTFISTYDQKESHPVLKDGIKGLLNNWLSPEELDKVIHDRFPGCMKGRTMYVIPFSMGPIESPLSKIGIELTDSPYVVCCMKIMTRMGSAVMDRIGDHHFVKSVHSMGAPYPIQKPLKNNWPCNPEKTVVLHIPHMDKIMSYGSGYGGNSLLGKKCFALRIGSTIARDEGWLAEHMLISGITNTKGKKKYFTGAFPSACGKTNLALITPTLKGMKVECVGDDIAWMKFNDEGRLMAINPENGFFGVAPGTSDKSNPNAMKTIFENTVFTNVARTSDGGVYWEGMGVKIPPEVKVTTWLGEAWEPGSDKKAAHPNSRFCAPAKQCPVIDPKWEDPAGVPVEAILFGGRRPKGVPLVIESFDWNHGVFLAACLKSEATAAAEFHGKLIMHDPFAMRPFFGYNFGDYLRHWLSMKDKPNVKLPKIYHVNWFRVDEDGKYLWPGFGENCRVLDWIMRRIDGEDVAEWSPLGWIPKPGSINLEGLDCEVNWEELLSIPKSYWLQDISETRSYFEEQVGSDLPQEMWDELDKLKNRIEAMP